MAVSMYAISVPVFRQMLGSLNEILAKAQTYCAAKNIEPGVLVTARLFPDMFALGRQVQIACEFARGVSARLADLAVPSNDDKENSFEELMSLITRTLAFLEELNPMLFENSEERPIVLRAGTPKEKKLVGQSYVLSYGLPQFFFHITTAFAILRHNGVEVGKRDYMGVY